MVCGIADAVAEAPLCYLSLNYSMTSYLLQVNALLQNIWKAIVHTKVGRIGGNQGISFETLLPPFFVVEFIVSYTWFHPRTLLTRRMNFRPPLRYPHLCVWWGRRGSAVFFSPARTARTFCRSGPRRDCCNSIFCRNHMMWYSRGPGGQRVGWEATVSMGL